MKKINLLMVALIGAMTLTLTSCDECKDVTCDNGGVCEEGVCQCTDNFFGDACEVECVNGSYADGTCTCDAGYEGEACTVLSREDMIGTYSGNDACSSTGASDSYNSSVAASSASDEGVLITGLWDGFFINNITGTVDGDVITMPNQEPDSDGYTIEGTGTYSDGTISWSFTVTETTTNTVDQCTMTATKQ
ncbi:MAG: hypothetical protein Salg2KO_18250 [Salibacteraceae bacterium]